MMPPSSSECFGTQTRYGADGLPPFVPRSLQTPHYRGWQFSLMCCEPPCRCGCALCWCAGQAVEWSIPRPQKMFNKTRYFRRYVAPNWNLRFRRCYVQCVVRGRKNPLHHGLPDRLRLVLRLQRRAMSAASLDAGLPNDFVFHIERRQRLPRIDTIERLARTLGISPAWLTYGEGDATTPHPSLLTAQIGDRIRRLRLQRGLTAAALGRAAHITGQTIANIETGGMMPKVDTLEAIATALAVSPGWLAFGADTEASATASNEFVTSH